jgi:hypothetical protein
MLSVTTYTFGAADADAAGTPALSTAVTASPATVASPAVMLLVLRILITPCDLS